MAGDFQFSHSPIRVRSFSIVTCPPNELCGQIHNRVPVILPPEEWPLWLGEDAAEPGQLKAVLRPYPGDDMKMWPVSTRVGNVRNNDPSLIERLELTADERGAGAPEFLPRRVM